MSKWYVEHADTFSYEYTVVGECDTREEADHMCKWYRRQQEDATMSEYHVRTPGQLRGGANLWMLEHCASRREQAGYKPLGDAA